VLLSFTHSRYGVNIYPKSSSQKIALVGIGATAAFAIFVWLTGTILYRGALADAVDQFLRPTLAMQEADATLADATYRSLEDGLSFFLQTPQVARLSIAAETPDGVDPSDNTPLSAILEELQMLFTAWQEAHYEALQARVIGLGDGGRELLRVDVSDSGV
jgi:hypothetical protein